MPTRPPSRCTNPHPRCRDTAVIDGRCEQHQRPAWRNRTKWSERYGMSWDTWLRLCKQVMERDERRCYICGGDGADQVDHIVPISEGGSQRDLGNLAAIHEEPCHKAKSQAEAARATARRRRAGAGPV